MRYEGNKKMNLTREVAMAIGEGRAKTLDDLATLFPWATRTQRRSALNHGRVSGLIRVKVQGKGLGRGLGRELSEWESGPVQRAAEPSPRRVSSVFDMAGLGQ